MKKKRKGGKKGLMEQLKKTAKMRKKRAKSKKEY